MNIYKTLETLNVRVTSGYRWLILNDGGLWVVYERLPYAKKTAVVYEGTSESAACQALLEG